MRRDRSIPTRMAVCMGTEMPMKPARRTTSSGTGSIAASTTETLYPSDFRRAAGEARLKG